MGESGRAMILERPAPAATGPLHLVAREPPSPATGMLLLRVAACAVCRTDLQLRRGRPARCTSSPVVPGHQIGRRTSTAVGTEGVEGWQVGDRAASPGWRATERHLRQAAAEGARTCARPARSPAGTSTAASRRTASVRADFALPIAAGASTTWPRRRCCAAAPSATGRSSAAGIASGCAPGPVRLRRVGAASRCRSRATGDADVVRLRPAPPPSASAPSSLGAAWAGGY